MDIKFSLILDSKSLGTIRTYPKYIKRKIEFKTHHFSYNSNFIRKMVEKLFFKFKNKLILCYLCLLLLITSFYSCLICIYKNFHFISYLLNKEALDMLRRVVHCRSIDFNIQYEYKQYISGIVENKKQTKITISFNK